MTDNHRTSLQRKTALVILACYWIALVIGTHIPRPPQEIFPLGTSDKWLHLSAYAGLAFLISLNWSLRRALNWRHFALVWGALALFGALDEVTQIPVGRECDVLDWTADVTGTLGGIAVFLAASLLWRRPASPVRRT